MKNKKTKLNDFYMGRYYFIAALFVVAGLSFTRFRFVSLLACVVLWGLYWPFSRKIDSRILRLFLAFLLTTCFQELLGAVFWLIHKDFTVQYAILAELLVVAWLYLRFGKAAKISFINSSDVVSLIVAVGSTIALTAGMLHGSSVLPQLVRQITTGYDGSNHLSLVLSDYDHKGYVYGPPKAVKQQIVIPKLSSYPQGWALTTSLWWHSISSNLNIRLHPTKVLALFYSAVFIWFMVLVFLFNRLTLYLARMIAGKPPGFVALAGSIFLTFLAELLGIIGVVSNNFASFLPAIVLPLGMAFLVVALIEDTNDKKQPDVFLVSGLLIAGGLSFSWLLAAPAAYIATMLGLLMYFQGNVVSILKWLISKPIILTTAALLLVLGSVQGLIQVHFGSGGLINQTGGAVPVYVQILFPMLLFVLLAFYLGKSRSIKKVFAATTSGIFLASAYVYFFQVASVGYISYYTLKLALIAFILVFAFAGSVLLVLLNNWVSNGRDKISGVIFALCLVAFIPVAAGINFKTVPGISISSVNYLQGERILSEGTAIKLGSMMVNGQGIDNNFIMYKGLYRPEDVNTSHFMQMLSRKPLPDCNKAISAREHYEWSINPAQIATCANGKTFYVIGSAKTYSALLKQFRDYPNIKVLASN